MKKGYKVVIIVISAIVVLLTIVSLLVSPIAKWYIEKNCKELVGRRVTVDELSVRLLLGQLSVDGFVLYEPNDVDTFVSIEHLDADMRVWGIIRKSIEVDSINIVAPHATILREGNSLNFDDMLSFFAQKSVADSVEKSDSDWKILLRDIGLYDGVVRYADDVLHIDWTMNHIKLNIPELDLSGRGTNAQLYLDFARGGSMELQAMYDQQQMDYDMNCHISDYPLGVLMPFMENVVNVGAVTGRLDVDLHAQGNMNNIMASNLDGAIRMDSTVVTDVEGMQLLSLKEFKTVIEHINVSQDYIIKLRELSIDELVARYEVYEDGTNNFSTLMASRADSVVAENEPSVAEVSNNDTAQHVHTPKLDLSITDLQMKNSSFTYVDNTLPEPFSMRMSKMRFKSPDFTMRGHNSIELFSVLQETGALRMKWDGDIEAQEHDLTITLNNFNLKELSPYSLSFFGYPITDGKMSFRGQNIISDGQLKGSNKLSLYNPTLDKKRTDVDAEYGMIPLKLAVVVLTDREGKADIDLPVSGNIRSPHFSYGKIIVKALTNVLIKIAAAPIDLLAGALGLNSDEVKEIEFGAWQHQFTPEQYDKIEKLSKLVTEKPQLAVKLIHEVNYEKGIQAIVENDFRRDYYVSLHPDRAESLNMVDIDTYRAIPLKGEQVALYADSLLVARGLPVDGSLSDKMHRLYGDGALDKLMRNVAMRDRGMMMQWSRVLNMPEGSLQIVSPTREEIVGATGKTRYKVEMSVADETQPEETESNNTNSTETLSQGDVVVPVEQ